MNDLATGVLVGVGIGVVVAVIGNVMVLPLVLRHQERTLSNDFRLPVFGWDKGRLATATRNAYRFFMPVFFGLLGTALAVNYLGANK